MARFGLSQPSGYEQFGGPSGPIFEKKKKKVASVPKPPSVLGTSTTRQVGPVYGPQQQFGPQPAPKTATQTSGGVSTYQGGPTTDFDKYRALIESRDAQQRKDRERMLEADRKSREEAEERAQRIFDEQQNQLGSAQQNLLSQLSGLELPENILSSLSEEMGLESARTGVQGLREQISRIQGQLRGLPENLQSRISRSGLTEGQRQALLGKEENVFRKRLGDVSGVYETAVAGLGDIRGDVQSQYQAALRGQEQKLQPFKTAVDYARENAGNVFNQANERIARQLANFDVNREASLNALADKFTRLGALDNAELQELSDLAVSERKFINGGATGGVAGGIFSDPEMQALLRGQQQTLGGAGQTFAVQEAQQPKGTIDEFISTY